MGHFSHLATVITFHIGPEWDIGEKPLDKEEQRCVFFICLAKFWTI